jgi:rare lipoprotein A
MTDPTFRPGHVNGRRDRFMRRGRRARVLASFLRSAVRVSAVSVALVVLAGASPSGAAAAAAASHAGGARAIAAPPPLPGGYMAPAKISNAGGRRPRPPSVRPAGPSFSGRASWYGPGFHGRRTASGERFDSQSLTAAHRSLAFGTRLRVCHGARCVLVRVNDRGPYSGGRVLDLSSAAARQIGLVSSGVDVVTASVVVVVPSRPASHWGPRTA